MRKIVAHFTIVCLLFLANTVLLADTGKTLPDSGNSPQHIVTSDIARQVVAVLPDDIHFRVLGIGEIEGESTVLTEALTSAINSGTNFHLIERVDLEKLLKEQGVQLSPLSDPNSQVQPGRIQGVEGLLIGRIAKQTINPFFADLQVYLKLDNVETGSVVFARNFSATHIPRTTIYLAAACLAILAALLLRPVIRTSRVRRAERFVERHDERQLYLEAELRKSRGNLDRAHDHLVEQERLDLAVQLKRLNEDLGNLFFQLEQYPAMQPDQADGSGRKEQNQQHRWMHTIVKSILSESEKVLQAAQKNNDSGVRAAIDRLTEEVKNGNNRSLNRSTGRA